MSTLYRGGGTMTSTNVPTSGNLRFSTFRGATATSVIEVILSTNRIAAYSVRRLTSTYSGPVVNVRRSSDNVTSDFYSDSIQSYINTAGGVSLSTWLNGATGYVTKWYDQTGNANHAYNNTNNTTQPIIVYHNTFNKYILSFDRAYSRGFTTTSVINPNSVFAHFYNTNTYEASLLNTGGVGIRFGYNMPPTYTGAGTNINGDYSTSADWYYGGGGTKLSYVNNIASTTTPLSTWNIMSLSVQSPITLNMNLIAQDGYSATERSLTGYIIELICYSRTVSVSEINDYYTNRFK